MVNPEEKRLIHISSARKSAEYVCREVEALGYKVDSHKENGVFLKGNYRDCMRLNLHLRTAYRVLWHLGDVKAPGPDDLYRKARKLEWERIIEPEGYISINSHVENSFILDNRFANVRLKDAIVDRFNEIYGKRPDSGPDTDKTVIYLYWVEGRASLYLDTSGGPLSKHGYRKFPYKAPLLEGLGASIIMASRWDGQSSFINPMCGSGTLAIEAALMGIDKVPGLMKDNFGFMHTLFYNQDVWEELRTEALGKVKNTVSFKIVASDINEVAIDAARNNAAMAGVDHLIEFSVCDFRDTPVYNDGGVVIINPEYGERLGETSELEDIYKAMGDFFKAKCQGYTGYIFTGNFALAKKIGLRTSRRIEFYNATIECRLLEFELYSGSRKITPND
ncbi:MAG: class I SAM-dependent RNA methyltransferase [Cytophagaceae bacterium]